MKNLTKTLLLLVFLFAFNFAQSQQRIGKGIPPKGQKGINNHHACKEHKGPNNHHACKGHDKTASCKMLRGIADLTEEQKTKAKKIHVDYLKQVMPLKSQMNEQRAKYQSLSVAESVNLSEVDAVIEKLASLKTKMMKLRFKKMQKIKSILTEEQKVMLNFKILNRKKGHGKH